MTTKNNIRLLTVVSLSCALLGAACTTENICAEAPQQPDADIAQTENAAHELMVKFTPEAAEIIENSARTRGGELTRSGVVSVDEVLEAVEGYRLERVFPVDRSNEERTREAGLHQWYVVRFGGDMAVEDAVKRFARIGEVQSAIPNRIIQHAYKGRKARPLSNEQVAGMTAGATRAAGYPYNDALLQYQWHLINRGDMFPGKAVAGADVQCEKAWEMSKGDPSIVVAVLDEGVFLEHPDLKDNMWVNEGEIYRSKEDNDGNGYKGDYYGYNFANDTGVISWDNLHDSGHATHVAGVIAACNDNGIGISSIAGGTQRNPGVRIMSCQIFSSDGSTSVLALVRGTKYATDNGAVILQCSFGYTSGAANIYDWGYQGFQSEEEWSSPYYGSPLEKEALDYFTHNAGSPNGPIDGGIAIFAAGNESAPMAGFPGAAAECVSVTATAADFTPAVYTNYGEYSNIAAPGGDQDYYYEYGGTNEPATDYDGNGRADNFGEAGCVLSTLPYTISESGYGYMEGTSMACPHVSGVAALGLSYAMQLRRHFTAAEFRELLYRTVTPIDDYMSGTKQYYRYVADVGQNQMMQMVLSNYRGKMGVGQVNAERLLKAIEGAGRPIEFPNLYVPFEGEIRVTPGNYFKNGGALTYTVTVEDASVASASVQGQTMVVRGLKEGTTGASVKASDGTVQSFVITVRKGASDKGWL